MIASRIGFRAFMTEFSVLTALLATSIRARSRRRFEVFPELMAFLHLGGSKQLENRHDFRL
jgi:hypothetical protein